MVKIKITNIEFYKVFDSNGNFAIEAKVILNRKYLSYGYSPRGSTLGDFECKQYYEEIDLHKEWINSKMYARCQELKKVLLNFEFENHRNFDEFLISLESDKSKSYFGGNLILAVSIAVIYGVSKVRNCTIKELISNEYSIKCKNTPIPMFNLLDGIKGHETSGLECLLIPTLDIGIEKIISYSFRVYEEFEKILSKKFVNSNFISKQGGYSNTSIKTLNEILEISSEAIKNAGFEFNNDFNLGIDVAATDIFNNNKYLAKWINNTDLPIDSLQLIKYYCDIINKFPISYIEDGFSDSDYEAWQLLLAEIGTKSMVAGDDLFATNANRLETYNICANTAIIKPNQVGTILETVNFILECQSKKIITVVSQRTSEIEFNLISHIAYACDVNFLKAGGLKRMERISRYNEIIRLVNNKL